VGRSDETGLAQAYHQGCQLMAVAVLPLAAMFVFFSREILMLWQRNPETTENTWLPLSILMAGSALNAMLTVPYALQLAHAWTKLHFYGLLIAVVLLAPLTFAGAVYYGTIGAAAVWVLLNVSFILFEIPLIHKNILPNESSKWYLHDFGLPLFSVLITVGIARYGYVSSGNAFVSILQLGLISAAVFGAAILSSSLAREYVFKKLPGVR
jgi:O-antigen/teichoic acid export membrane protein